MRHGCPLYQSCRGNGVGVKYKAENHTISAGRLRGDRTIPGSLSGTRFFLPAASLFQWNATRSTDAMWFALEARHFQCVLPCSKDSRQTMC